MDVTDPQPAYVLSFHAEYACRHSTACCVAPWAIALDAGRTARVAREIEAGALSPPRAVDDRWLAGRTGPGSGAPAGLRVLHRDAAGACVFLEPEGGHCAIHRACGHDMLPEACQQFPRATLIDDRGIHVTLSHYCPTVTALTLAEPGARVAIVPAPSGFARSPLAAGLDARGHWPPLLRPGVMCSAGTWSAWEAWAIDRLANETGSPRGALAVLAGAADELRRWRSADGEQERFVGQVLECRGGAIPNGPTEFDPVACWDTVWSAVPPDRSTRPRLDHDSPGWRRALEAALAEVDTHGRPVGRYLAARAFASWCAYQGRGLRTHVASLRAALGVLVVELARGFMPGEDDIAVAPPGVDAPLAGALQRADWLLVHLAEGDALARTWTLAEAERAD